MPTVTEKTIDGYAHCHDGHCPGNRQQPVKVIVALTEFSYVDFGGDIPGTERSTSMVRFADLGDAQCPHCGEPREAADQKRPIYPNVSGVPQDRLLTRYSEGERLADAELRDARHDAAMAQMEATLLRQQQLIEQLLAEREQPKPKRAPTA